MVNTRPAGVATKGIGIFGKTYSQSKSVLLIAMLSMPQLSMLPSSISAAVMVASPLASKTAEAAWQSAVGARLSTTVTLAEQKAEFPAASVTSKIVLGGVLVTTIDPIALSLVLE